LENSHFKAGFLLKNGYPEDEESRFISAKHYFFPEDGRRDFSYSSGTYIPN